jgi:glucosamine-6-phosphate deaminase
LSLQIEISAAESWAPATAERLADRVVAHPAMRLCLPTGKTPEPAYAAFAEAGGRLDDATVFLLDEFVLPAGHPARCDEMLRRALLDRLARPPRELHRFDTEGGNLDAECVGYDALVRSGGLDLTLLGLGANGHIGLNEPGSDATSPTRVVELHPATVRHSKQYGDGPPPARGLTLGLATILQSSAIWLLVTGGHKAEILARALEGPITTEVPASFLREHAGLTILADEPAARLLSAS